MPIKRTQLTLFINEKDSAEIEKIRKEFNPEQYKLIKSHVTLCREDELNPIEKVLEALNNLKQRPITIDFDVVTRFADGKGVLLPASGNNQQFFDLRKAILQNTNHNPAKQEPHITLMHPRNSTCDDRIFEQIQKFEIPGQLIFHKISLIEQIDGGPWSILQEFELKDTN